LQKAVEIPATVGLSASKKVGPWGLLSAGFNDEVKEGLGVLIELRKHWANWRETVTSPPPLKNKGVSRKDRATVDDLSIYFRPKPDPLHPVAKATIKALTCFCLFGLWPKIQATRFTGAGRSPRKRR